MELSMLSIRPAKASDTSLLVSFINELANFEHLPATVTEADLLRDGFGERPKFRVLVAEWNGDPAGYAFFFDYYSTFEGRPGIFLEDLYVREQYRGKKIGKALLAEVAMIAQVENCFGVRWQVLDWNKPAIEFYRQIGALFLDEWKTISFQGKPLERLASSAGNFSLRPR
jgi:GNAT superfamily N-acetyltransferase